MIQIWAMIQIWIKAQIWIIADEMAKCQNVCSKMCVIANGAVAERSKASVTTLAHEKPQSVSSTPADDAGETDWTTYGKVAIFCNL